MSSRAAAAWLLLVLVAAHAPVTVEAQSAPADAPADVELEDKSGDVMFNAGTRAGVPPQNAATLPINTDHLDILGVTIGRETEKEFEVELRLKALNAAQVTPFPIGFALRAVTFAYGGIDWQIRVGACQGNQGGQGGVAGCLGFKDGGSRDFRSHMTIPAEANTGDSAFIFTVPKDAIFDKDRAPARYGASLGNISARTYQWFMGLPFFPGDQGDPTGGVQAVDFAPDAGVADAVFTFFQGSGSRGHLALQSREPIRVSNGEATTIVYKVDLFNDADRQVTAELTVDGLRKEWTARVPSLIKLDAQASVTFPVILALPFTHEHGMTATFTVKAKDVEDSDSYAAVDLGVFWTDVPQPSAHHNGEMWFHSAPADTDNTFFSAVPQVLTFTTGWMNSIEDDPDPSATDANVGGFPTSNAAFCAFSQGGPTACGVPPANTVGWFFPLSPKLLIGLDFDILGKGKLIADILPKVSATNAQLTASVLYCDPTARNENQGQGGGGGGGGNNQGNSQQNCNQYNVLLASGFTARAITANTPANFEVPLTIEPIADLLPYKSGANIALRLSLLTDTPQTVFGTEPRPEFVTKNGRLYLPLIEYHDPVAAEFQNVGSLQLDALSGFEKQVNPGETTLFNFNLTNKGSVKQKIQIELEGVNQEWSALRSPQEFQLAPGVTQTITVSVAPPIDAAVDERAELFLVAHNPEDESIVTVTRLRATVVTDPDLPDEALSLAVESEGTPSIALWAGVAALGVVAALRRRR